MKRLAIFIVACAIMTSFKLAAADQAASVTVNVPKLKGGSVPVTIHESDDGDGFFGPQGEYYFQFPTLASLEQTYGRQF